MRYSREPICGEMIDEETNQIPATIKLWNLASKSTSTLIEHGILHILFSVRILTPTNVTFWNFLSTMRHKLWPTTRFWPLPIICDVGSICSKPPTVSTHSDDEFVADGTKDSSKVAVSLTTVISRSRCFVQWFRASWTVRDFFLSPVLWFCGHLGNMSSSYRPSWPSFTCLPPSFFRVPWLFILKYRCVLHDQLPTL